MLEDLDVEKFITEFRNSSRSSRLRFLEALLRETSRSEVTFLYDLTQNAHTLKRFDIVGNLPLEILGEIFANLSPVDLVRSRSVCRRWLELLTSSFTLQDVLNRMFPEESQNLLATKTQIQGQEDDEPVSVNWLGYFDSIAYRKNMWRTSHNKGVVHSISSPQSPAVHISYASRRLVLCSTLLPQALDVYDFSRYPRSYRLHMPHHLQCSDFVTAGETVIAFARFDNRFYVFDADTEELIKSVRHFTSCRSLFSNGKVFGALGWSDSTIYGWDVQTGETVLEFDIGKFPPLSHCVARNGSVREQSYQLGILPMTDYVVYAGKDQFTADRLTVAIIQVRTGNLLSSKTVKFEGCPGGLYLIEKRGGIVTIVITNNIDGNYYSVFDYYTTIFEFAMPDRWTFCSVPHLVTTHQEMKFSRNPTISINRATRVPINEDLTCTVTDGSDFTNVNIYDTSASNRRHGAPNVASWAIDRGQQQAKGDEPIYVAGDESMLIVSENDVVYYWDYENRE